MSPNMIKVLAGVVALVVLGGMVFLLVNLGVFGNPGGGESEDPNPTQQAEQSTDEDTSPEEENTPDRGDGTGTEMPCIGNC
jgi:hypothetical protein